MTSQDLVRPSRDGDQFHYHWAARQCLQLLPGTTDLAAVTIEGPSKEEAIDDELKEGNQLIDVGLYFGDERSDQARLIRYIQLKHSTLHAREPWTASGLKKTVRGFAQRYAKIIEHIPPNDVSRRFRFEFTTNRPIDSKVKEALEDLASGAVARHASIQELLIKFTGLTTSQAAQFFSLFTAEGNEKDLWTQRNLLTQDLNTYLPDADLDAPIQLKELVTRKATSEFDHDNSILRHDVLRALKTTEEQLSPAPCRIPDATNTLPREQEAEILRILDTSQSPLVIHSEGGVGKSIIAARLAASMPPGSEAILYDCFGDGLYRNALGFRHRHRDALVQISNELAARGLCHPLIPTAQADTKQYMRAFIGRLNQAMGLLRARKPDAQLCILIDAADNAQMAAEEQREPSSFVRDLIRTPMPQGVQLVFTCRTHRRQRLEAPPEVQEVELRPFTHSESARHLRSVYPAASDAEASEFAFVTSSNPRVQALALSRGLPLHEMLKQLGPEPTTVERAISELLDAAVARLRDHSGPIEVSQIDLICQSLAVLRPPVPIPVLAHLSGTSESAVRSFALDFGRPLLLKGNSLQFLDEPTETWFHEHFQPDTAGLTAFLERLRPITAYSSYAAATLPQLLLRTGKLDELVELALSEENLPTENPLERRDVELRRLIFALKACLQRAHYVAAAKLALKAGGECAGERRQNRILQENTDVAAILMAPDRIAEIVSRRTFGAAWMGSHHAYNAGLLSGREEFFADASSHLRMAREWLNAWSRRAQEERRHEPVTDADNAELAMAMLRLRSSKTAARFLRQWRPRFHTFVAGRLVGQRLLDLGRYDQLDSLSIAAGNDLWLLLGLAAEARAVGRLLPVPALTRLLRLLTDRRVKLPEAQAWDKKWAVLDAVRAVVELALQVLPPQREKWAVLLRRYLPGEPPSTLASRFESERFLLLRAYALEAALRGQRLDLRDIAPANLRKQMEVRNHYHSQEMEVFQTTGRALLPWFSLLAEISCGRPPTNLATEIQAAVHETSTAIYRDHQDHDLRQTVALEWFRLLRDTGTVTASENEIFKSWLGSGKNSLSSDTLISLCRSAARADGYESLAMDFAGEAYEALETSREGAEVRAGSYLNLARAILTVSPSESLVYFNRAVEIASRIGDENLDRWTALLHLAKAAGEGDYQRPQTAYRLSRAAELTYEYVVRDKHFAWNETVEALTDLCASSAVAILSRWRDRRFGDPGRLLPILVYRLINQGRLPATTPLALGGLTADWERLADLRRFVSSESDSAVRSLAARIAYRYMRIQPAKEDTWSELKKLDSKYDFGFQDIDRLVAVARIRPSEKDTLAPTHSMHSRALRAPNWETIFQGVDLTDSAALRSAYAKVRTYDPPYEFEAFFRQALSRVKIGREPELIRAIGIWSDFGIFELKYLMEALPSSLPKHVSLRNAVREAVLSACRHEPQRVYRHGWAALSFLKTLHTEGIVPDGEVVHAMLEGFAVQVDRLEAGELFKMLDPLAAYLSPKEADDALNFGLDLLEEILRTDDGDGPWRAALQPPRSIIHALAGYIWAGLGSPVVAERWEYAHVVRSVIELGWTEVLEPLIQAATTGTAVPFVDDGLEFYSWHARQWLLIGFARGALENATALRPATKLLLDCLRIGHVLIRELSAQTLRTLVAAGEWNGDEAGDFNSVNMSNLPEMTYSEWLSPDEDEALGIEETQQDNNDELYYFGIDIGPYWFGPLGRAFGVAHQSIERRARFAVRRFMGWSRGISWQEDARHTRKIFTSDETYHSRSDLPKIDDLCAYHGYHAMMLVASELLQERPVRRRAEESLDDFREWLSRYLPYRADGRWLADRRDPRLVVDPSARTHYGIAEWRWGVTADYLDQKLLTDDGMTVLWGHWTSSESEHSESVSVRSALASIAGAEALVAALQTAPELGRVVLPRARDEDNLAVGPLKLTGWISYEVLSDLADEKDPWATGMHYPGHAPSEDTIARLGLTQRADGRIWTNSSGVVVRSEIWTYNHGYGRQAETVSGERVSANRELLKQLFEGYPGTSLILSVEVRRSSPRRENDEDESETYQQPYTRYYMMKADGIAHAL